MAKKKLSNYKEKRQFIHPEAKASIIAVFSLGIAIVLVLAGFDRAGFVGKALLNILTTLMGLGYWLLPATLLVVGFTLLTSGAKKVVTATLLGGLFVLFAGLGIIDIVYPDKGGWLGNILGSFELLFGYWAALIINLTILVAALIVTFNTPLKISGNWILRKKGEGAKETPALVIKEPEMRVPEATVETAPREPQEEVKDKKAADREETLRVFNKPAYKTNYVPPPLGLLRATSEKPTV